jgi:RNA polymerase sigma-70 factor (ECF subfamily)
MFECSVESKNLTDEEVARLSAKDSEYYAIIVERYEIKIKRYLMRIYSRNDQDLEDILQDIFLKVYENIYGFDHSLKFSSWIYRIAHNESVNRIKKRKNNPEIKLSNEETDLLMSFVKSDDDIPKELAEQQKYNDIDRVLARMDSKYRNILILKFLEDKNYTEISDILKIPMGTVATQINRAKRNFKQEAVKLNIQFS